MSRRNPAVLGVWGPGKPRVRAVPATFNAPLKWNKTDGGCHCRRVFLGSLMDWLDYEVKTGWRVDALNIIDQCPDLDFLCLTKRIESWEARLLECASMSALACRWLNGEPPPNIWLGVTCENQEAADRRIPELLRIPAKVRFLSVEPLLEPVDLSNGLGLMGAPGDVDWVIVGGESGGNRRDCGVDAIVSVAEQCRAAGVPVFVKQDCAAKPGQQGRIPDNIWNLKQFPNIEQEAQ
jgi:protein gp37